MKADDPVLIAYALVRASINRDDETVVSLWNGTDDKQNVLMHLVAAAGSAVETTAQLLGISAIQILDDMVRLRVLGDQGDPA